MKPARFPDLHYTRGDDWDFIFKLYALVNNNKVSIPVNEVQFVLFEKTFTEPVLTLSSGDEINVETVPEETRISFTIPRVTTLNFNQARLFFNGIVIDTLNKHKRYFEGKILVNK